MKRNLRVTRLSAGKIVEIKELPDGTFEVFQETSVFDDYVLVEAESLSRNDAFMEYRCKTSAEIQTKHLIDEAIRKQVKNFYRPKYDPAFGGYGDSICFEPGKQPAVGKSYLWWVEEARRYEPKFFSRLGTRLEYGAFLGVLIKKLIEDGRSVDWAWNAVCNDSQELGSYWNSDDSRYRLELTGSRGACGFYDLANTFKILKDHGNAGEDCWIVGGSFMSMGDNNPLSSITDIKPWWCSDATYYAVGWIVVS